MTGRVTSVPLPDFWFSKNPEQYRRSHRRANSCRNPRCAASNSDSTATHQEPPGKKLRRLLRSGSTSKSVSLGSSTNPCTPDRSEGSGSKRCVGRCGDCNAILPMTSRPLSTASFTPPTPVSALIPTPGSWTSVCCTNSSAPSSSTQTGSAAIVRDAPLYLQTRTGFRNSKASSYLSRNIVAPPPSECGDGDGEGLLITSPKPLIPPMQSGEKYAVVDNQPSRIPLFYGSSTSVAGPEFTDLFCSFPIIETTEPTSPAPPSSDGIQGIGEARTTCRSRSLNGTNTSTSGVQSTGTSNQDTQSSSMQGNRHPLPLKIDVVGHSSDSSPSPPQSEKGFGLSNHLCTVCGKDPISSFYNVLYTPETSDEQEVDLYLCSRSGEQAIKLKAALEIAVLSALLTILIIVCFPTFLGGLRSNVFGSCSCPAASSRLYSNVSPHFWHLKWFERWAYKGTQNLLKCPLPQQAIGSTLLK